MIDRSAILRRAHAATRERMQPRRYPGPGYKLDRARNGFCPTFTYAEAFRSELRKAWAEAKRDAAYAAADAARPSTAVPADVAQRIANLDALAWASPITFGGNRRAEIYSREALALRAAYGA